MNPIGIRLLSWFLAKSPMAFAFVCATTLFPTVTQAQFGPRPPSGPSLHGANARLFGDNSAFSATTLMSTKDNGEDIAIPGMMAFDGGNTRFEMDMTQMKNIKKKDAEEMRAMGMDKMIAITRPDKKVTYQVWPGFKSYTEMALTGGDSSESPSDYKIEITPVGKETIDGHPCEKNKVLIIGKTGERHESMVWNANDLKSFPVQMEMTDEGRTVRMNFKDVRLEKPGADQFEPPAGFKRYNTMQDMMMTEMMKREGAAPAEGAESPSDKSSGKDSKKSKNPFSRKLLPF